MIKSPFTKLTFLLAFSLLNSSLATAMISPLASLGGNIQIGGKKQSDADLKKQGINRDLNHTQIITKNQQTGGLDATVTVDHRLASEEGRQQIANDVQDTYEHGEDIYRAAASEGTGIADKVSAVHQNAQLTQLKNDLVRNPDNAQLLADLNSQDPDTKAQAMVQVAKMAQAKFGIAPKDLNLYDSETTTSSSLKDNALSDVKGATVTDKNNSQYGQAFVDVGDNASEQDIANTMGHETSEQINLAKGGSHGLFGKRDEQSAEAMNNAFGNQFADRLNQATGGTLSGTGSNFKGTKTAQNGTQAANQVGNASVRYRQFDTKEGAWLNNQVKGYAQAKGISESQAKKDLTQAALTSIDSTHNHQIEATEGNQAALGWLANKAKEDGNMPKQMAALVSAQQDAENNHTSAQDKSALREQSGYYNREKNAETWNAPNTKPLYQAAVGGNIDNGPTANMRDKRADEICNNGGCGDKKTQGFIAGVLNETAGLGLLVDPENIKNPEAKQGFEQGSVLTLAATLPVTGTRKVLVEAGQTALKGLKDVPKNVKDNQKIKQEIAGLKNIGKNSPNHKPELHANINKRAEIETAHNDAKAQNWKKDGKPIYPNNKKGYDALPGTQKKHTIQKGDVLTRYVSKKDINKHHNGKYKPSKDTTGRYTAPENVPFDKRAMPGKESDYELFKFKAKKPIESDRSKATPWFDKKGRGNQDYHKPISELVKPGKDYIELVE